MASISINSLIASISSSRAAISAPPSVRSPISPAAESGAVFTRSEPWRNRADSVAASGYSRKDAAGQRPSGQPTGNELQSGQPVETASSAPDKATGVKEQTPRDAIKKPNGEFLSRAEMALVRELQKADQAVKAHEMAHLAAAGGYAKGGASFSYQRGPDGQNYAVGGEVQVDTGKEATPEATIQKMQTIRRAALAPVDPSPQDQQVAAHATLQIAEASKELLLAQSAEPQAGSPPRQAPEESKDTARAIYQGAARDLGPGSITDGGNKLKKSYAAYSKPLPPASRSDRQGLYQIA